MTDLSTTIAPKSDQLNSDDLIAGPRTIKITRVVGNTNKDQPISIFFEGDNGKPYLPCKSMRRVLVHLWGKDGSTYPGRSMTLFRDPHVKFGGIEVGGIRISHLSDIESDEQLMLTSTRGKKEPHSVRKLVPQVAPGMSQLAQDTLARIKATTTQEALQELVPVFQDLRERKAVPPAEYRALTTAASERKKELEALPISDTNGNADEEYGE